MGFQIPLMIINRRGVSIMSVIFPNPRVSRLRVVRALRLFRKVGKIKKEYSEKVFSGNFRIRSEILSSES